MALVRAGLIETEWADILADEQDERVAADYSISVAWEAPTTSRLLEDARASVQRMREYLASIGIPAPK